MTTETQPETIVEGSRAKNPASVHCGKHRIYDEYRLRGPTSFVSSVKAGEPAHHPVRPAGLLT